MSQPDDPCATAARRAWRRVADDPIPFVVVLIVIVALALTVVTTHVVG